MTSHTLRRALIWTLAAALGLALFVPGLPHAADKGKERVPEARPAPFPSASDRAPYLANAKLKMIERTDSSPKE